MSRMSARKEAKRIKDIAPDLAVWALWTAFPARSANECSEIAASVLGGHPDTYRRILGKETQRVSFKEMLPVLAMACAKCGIDLFETVGTAHAGGSQKGVGRAPVVERSGADRGRQGEEMEGTGDQMARPGHARADQSDRAA